MDDRIQKLERDLRLVKRYAVGATVVLGALALAAFRQPGRTKFTEIDVERINIVEKDGKTRIAIANRDRMAPITFYGKEYPDARRVGAGGRAGMIFFNDEGTENGGLGFSGRRLPDGTIHAMGGLTFDQYNQDEAVGLAYIDENGRRWAGLVVFDEPEVSLQPWMDSVMAFRKITDTAERARRTRAYREIRTKEGGSRASRLFAGKDVNKASVVALSDRKGKPRARLSVDSLGVGKLEFLDENGKVTAQFPDNK